MGDDSHYDDNSSLKNLKNEWSLLWGQILEGSEEKSEENSELVPKAEKKELKLNSSTQFQQTVDGAKKEIEKIHDLSQSLSLHKKLLDVEIENVQKEIEKLAISLSQEIRQSSEAAEIRQRLKELFIVEENLNVQLDSLQKRMMQNRSLEEKMIKGVS